MDIAKDYIPQDWERYNQSYLRMIALMESNKMKTTITREFLISVLETDRDFLSEVFYELQKQIFNLELRKFELGKK